MKLLVHHSFCPDLLLVIVSNVDTLKICPKIKETINLKLIEDFEIDYRVMLLVSVVEVSIVLCFSELLCSFASFINQFLPNYIDHI